MNNEPKPKLITLHGKKPGKTVSIFAGVHGNELTGINVLNHLAENTLLESGTLHLVYAHPLAIERGVRYVEKNLNRLFSETAHLDTLEGRLSQQLKEILDTSDALLDLHAFSQAEGDAIPFAICDGDCMDFLSKTQLKFILGNLHAFEQGSTDQYMFFRRKQGICVELGALEKPEEFFGLGVSIAQEFLSFHSLINHSSTRDIREEDQVYLRTCLFYKKKHEDFKFTRTLKSFDYIEKNEIFAFDGQEEISYPKDTYIIFPRDDLNIGEEVFILAEKV